MKDTITLAQGLEAFRRSNSKYFSDRQYSEKGKIFIINHDVAHVVFGCDTSFYGEGVVKVWTTFGSTLGFWKVLKGYHEVRAFSLFKAYSLKHIIRNIIKLFRAIPKTIAHTKLMSKPWPFEDYKPYLNMALYEVRKEFNIVILQ